MKCVDFAYPSLADFYPAATNVLAYFRKTDPDVDLACAIHCGWVCQGVAQSFLPVSKPVAKIYVPAFKADLLKELEKVAKKLKTFKGMKAAKVDWAAVLKIVLALLALFAKDGE